VGRKNNGIIIEIYSGYTSIEQAEEIAINLDRIRIHAYVNNLNIAFGISKEVLLILQTKIQN
jgi:hypothetical protein